MVSSAAFKRDIIEMPNPTSSLNESGVHHFKKELPLYLHLFAPETDTPCGNKSLATVFLVTHPNGTYTYTHIQLSSTSAAYPSFPPRSRTLALELVWAPKHRQTCSKAQACTSSATPRSSAQTLSLSLHVSQLKPTPRFTGSVLTTNAARTTA